MADDEDFFMTDTLPAKKIESDSDTTDDDWDIDEDEVAAKKAAKEAVKKAELEKEAERVRKLEERRKAEKEAEEERIRKLHEQKSAEQLEEELEAARYSEAADMLGGEVSSMKISVPNTPEDEDPDNPMAISAPAQAVVVQVSQPVVKREKDLYNFTPNCKPACIDYSKMLSSRLFEMSHDKNFVYLVDNCVKRIADEMPVEQWEAVKKLGSAITAIGNQKQQEFKKKNTKKTKKNTKPSLSGQNKAADPFGGGGGEEEYNDFDDFM